jgi:hypothetical protein
MQEAHADEDGERALAVRVCMGLAAPAGGQGAAVIRKR